MSHTPGPWTVRQAKVRTDGEYDHAILDSAGEVIAEAFGRVSPTETRPSGANAALIARAPEIPELECQRDELADALEAAERQYRERSWTDPASPRSPVHAIRAALRKAGRLPGQSPDSRTEYLGAGVIKRDGTTWQLPDNRRDP